MQAPQPFPFREHRSFADVLNATFVFLRLNARLLGRCLLWIGGPVVAFVALFGGLIQGLAVVPVEEQAEAAVMAMGAMMPLVFLASLLSLVFPLLIVYGYIYCYLKKGPDGFGVAEVWRVVKHFFWRFLGTLVALMVLLVGVYLLLIVPMALLAIIFRGWLIVVPVLGLIAALVYVMVLLMPLFPLRMYERHGLMASLGRSVRLVRGHGWATFGVMLIAFLLYMILGLGLRLPYLAVFGVLAVHAVDSEPIGFIRWLLPVVALVSGLGSLLLYPIPLVASALQYFSLVEEREQVGLQARVAAYYAEMQPAPLQDTAPEHPFEEAREEAPGAAQEEAPGAAQEEAPEAVQEEAPGAVQEEAPGAVHARDA